VTMKVTKTGPKRLPSLFNSHHVTVFIAPLSSPRKAGEVPEGRRGHFVTGSAQAQSVPPSVAARHLPRDAGRGQALKCLAHVHMHHVGTSAMLRTNKTFVLAPQSGGGARRAEGALCYRQRAGAGCAPLRRFAPPPPLRGARTSA
jgi:hypothetical protein